MLCPATLKGWPERTPKHVHDTLYAYSATVIDRRYSFPHTVTVSAAKIFPSASRAFDSVSGKISRATPVVPARVPRFLQPVGGKALDDQMQDAARVGKGFPIHKRIRVIVRANQFGGFVAGTISYFHGEPSNAFRSVKESSR